MMETRSWRLTEAVEMTRQCLFSTHPNPQQSKTKCIFMIGKNRNLVKPVPLQLCGRDLPWVESGNHLGHMLHQSDNMEHDASIARAKFIDQSVETRQAFSLQVYNSNHYGSMLWDLGSEAGSQFFNSWNTAVKLAWDCPRGTRIYLVQQVLAWGTSSARVDIMSRYCKFFRGLRNSPCREVSVLSNLVARDRRSDTGSNVQLVMATSGCDVWSDSPGKVRASLLEDEAVVVENCDKWRIPYLGTLLEHRQEWQYLGSDDEVENIQNLLDSLFLSPEGVQPSHYLDNIIGEDSTIISILLL